MNHTFNVYLFLLFQRLQRISFCLLFKSVLPIYHLIQKSFGLFQRFRVFLFFFHHVLRFLNHSFRIFNLTQNFHDLFFNLVHIGRLLVRFVKMDAEVGDAPATAVISIGHQVPFPKAGDLLVQHFQPVLIKLYL